MKCSSCAKNIPDGFADCPWCGANYGALPQPGTSSTQPVESSRNVVLVWVASALSLPITLFNAYGSTKQKFGLVDGSDSAFLIGAFLGPYIVSAVILLIYYAIRRQKRQASVQFLATACGASLLAVLSIVSHAAGATAQPGEAITRQPIKKMEEPGIAKAKVASANVWDGSTVAFLNDLHAYNEQYLGEVGKLESSAQLYTYESARDAATIHKVLGQLQARLAVAEKYSSLQPIADKLNGYVAAVDASDKEKQAFLAGFTASAQQMMALRDAASTKEREWLNASIEVYAFLLAHQGQYVIRGRNLEFRERGQSVEFNRKSQNALIQRQQFYQAQGAFTTSINAARAKLGLQP